MKKFTFGTPFATNATVISYPSETDALPYFTITKNSIEETGESCLTFSYPMTENTAIYGLGEQVRGINKRGHEYISWCSDDCNHGEATHSLYGAHNYFIVSGKDTFGVFIDHPGRVVFDMGCHDANLLTVTLPDDNADIYLSDASSLTEITKEFRQLFGRSYIPPKWAFGYQQSRWGYVTKEDFRFIADSYEENQLPLDALYMDIDYMDNFKDFTVNKEHFPDFAAFTEEMNARHIRLVPIIDAGVKIEKGYDVYEDGVKNGYFCKRADGSDFVAGVWPGKTHFPDVFSKDARSWFGHLYERLIRQGIEGFWNDMNEPAIFYSEEGLKNAWDFVNSFAGKEIDIHTNFALKDVFPALSNSMEDYKRFFHKTENTPSGTIRHDKVHNLYGFYLTRAAAEAFDEIEPEKRLLLFSRASYIGMHRYSGIWTGDNSSAWSHLLMNIQMMPALSMCGFLYSGADLGGFGGDCTRDLMLRWLSFGIFTPLMRNHSAWNTRNQELFRFGDCTPFRSLLQLRYRLIPYLYSEFVKAALSNEGLFRPLVFDYPDDMRAAHTEDELLFGEGLLLAPVYKQNADGRHVYLPEDMLYIKFTSATEYESCILPAGDHYIHVDLQEVSFFLRKNHLLPLCEPAQATELLNETALSFLGYSDGKASYTLYADDGYTKDIENPSHFHEFVQNGKEITLPSGYTLLETDFYN